MEVGREVGRRGMGREGWGGGIGQLVAYVVCMH